MHPVTVGLYRRFIRVKYANLVNIMLDRMLVPEFLQENCTPDNLAAAVAKLLTIPPPVQEQRDGVAEVGALAGTGWSAAQRTGGAMWFSPCLKAGTRAKR